MGKARNVTAGRRSITAASEMPYERVSIIELTPAELLRLVLSVPHICESLYRCEACGFEVRALHMHGPGGAGGAIEPRVRDVLAVKSVLLPKNLINAQILVEGTL